MAPTPDPRRPDWLPDTPHARAAEERVRRSHLLTPPHILAAYDWALGRCFQCSVAGRHVAQVAVVHTPTGDPEPLALCGPCLLAREEDRRAAAVTRGEEYVPGRIGGPR